MSHYFFTNVVLSISVLGFVVFTQAVSSRYKVYMSLSAMLAWIIPWHYIELPNNVLPMSPSLYLAQVSQVIQPIGGLDGVHTSSLVLAKKYGHNVDAAIPVLFMIGLCVFIYRFTKQIIQFNHLSKTASKNNNISVGKNASNIDIMVVPNSSVAFTSGVIFPRIWVGEQLIKSKYLDSIIRHELTHIRSGDNVLVLMIELLRDLFWWNPLVWCLARRCKEHIELSCDQACQSLDQEYSIHLGQLPLEKHRLESVSFSNSIFGSFYRISQRGRSKSRKFDLYRLDRLIEGNEVRLKTNRIPILFSFLLLVFFSITTPIFTVEASDRNGDLDIFIKYDDGVDSYELHFSDQEYGLLSSLEDISETHGVTYKLDYDNNSRISAHTFYMQDLEMFEYFKSEIEYHAFEKYNIDEGVKAQQISTEGLFNTDLSVLDVNGVQKNFSLLTTQQSWSGVRYDDVTVRIYPALRSGELFVMLDVSQWGNGQKLQSFSPSVKVKLGEAITIVFESGSESQVLPAQITLTLNRMSS